MSNLNEEEFEEHIENSFSKYSDEVKPIYTAFLIIHLALSDWKTVEQYESEYKKNPKLCIEEAIKHLKPKVPKEINDNNALENFATISIENILKFDSSDFFLLEDFQIAFEAFQKEEIALNLDSISSFLIPFQFQRTHRIRSIREYISEELFGKSDFENLNDFQKNRVADTFLETLEEYELEGLITTQFEEIEETLEKYLEIAMFLPDLKSKELKNLILTIKLPEEK